MRACTVVCFLSVLATIAGQSDYSLRLADTDQAFKAAGMLLNDYVKFVRGGRCNAVDGEAVIGTYISGPDLVANNITPPADVGPTGLFAGPYLTYLPDRTKLHWGNWCSDEDNFIKLPNKMISANSMAMAKFGNSLGSRVHPEIDTWFRVHDQQGNPTECILKLYMSTTGQSAWGLGNEYKPTSFLRKESGCDALPNLQIFETGHWCRWCYSETSCINKRLKEQKADYQCSIWPEKAVFGNTWLVYFDNKPVSRAASANDTDIVGTIIGGQATKGATVADGPSAAPGGNGNITDASTTPAAPSSPQDESPAPAAVSLASLSWTPLTVMISCAIVVATLFAV